jgi:hypothetical protein
MQRFWGAYPLLLLALMLGLTSCAVSVSLHVISDAAYKSVWLKDWDTIIAASAPWKPTADTPGVCNVGGNMQDCYATDASVATDLQILLSGLQSTAVPAEFASANSTTKRALTTDIAGLNERNQALMTNDDPLFTAALAKIHQAATLFVQGYAAFPAYDVPSPQPFGPGGYAG